MQWVCWNGDLLKRDCTVFSAGSKGDTSFEEGILKGNAGCKIVILDPFKLPSAQKASGFNLRRQALGAHFAKVCMHNSCDRAKGLTRIMNEEGVKALSLLKVRLHFWHWLHA